MHQMNSSPENKALVRRRGHRYAVPHPPSARPKGNTMQLDYSPQVQELHGRVKHFLDTLVFPKQQRREEEIAANAKAGHAYRSVPVVEELKAQAKAEGLWNLFLP